MAERKLEKSSLELGELPSNSMKSKQAVEKVEEAALPENVVSSPVKVKRKPASKRFLESIGVEDGRTVADYLVWDVVIPSVKDLLAAIVKNGVDVLLFGSVKGRGSTHSTSSSYRTDRTSYDRYYHGTVDARTLREPGYSYRPSRRGLDFSDIVFKDYRDENGNLVTGRASAELVFNKMLDILEDYKFVRIADFLALSNVPDRDITRTDYEYGWDSLGGCGIDRVRDGYIIVLPKPVSRD